MPDARQTQSTERRDQPRELHRLVQGHTGDQQHATERDRAGVRQLLHHVVAGRLSSNDLEKQIKAGKGTATLKTVSGGQLWAMMRGNDVALKDEKGGMAMVTQANVFQSN